MLKLFEFDFIKKYKKKKTINSKSIFCIKEKKERINLIIIIIIDISKNITKIGMYLLNIVSKMIILLYIHVIHTYIVYCIKFSNLIFISIRNEKCKLLYFL